MGDFQVLEGAAWFRLKEFPVIIYRAFIPVKAPPSLYYIKLPTHSVSIRSRTRQSFLRRDMRCFMLVGVDGSIINNEVGVGCGVLTEDTLTRLLQLEVDWYYGALRTHAKGRTRPPCS
jgi:hypothetical protein